MAYLSKAMGDILGEVESYRKKARERAERGRRDAEIARELLQTEEREAAEWVVKEQAFVEALPNPKALPSEEIRLYPSPKKLEHPL